MVGNASQSSAGLGQRKKFYQLSDPIRHGLGRKESVAKVSHRHNDIVGKTWYIRMVFRIEGDDNSNGGEDSSV